MRMTRETYAREVWKVVEIVRKGEETVTCPHEGCEKLLKVVLTSVRTGTRFVCPDHGIIYRE